MSRINPISDNEFTLYANGWSFHICLGSQINGNYIAIPDWGVCTEAARWDDVAWNKSRLANSLNETISANALAIASAVEQYMEG